MNHQSLATKPGPGNKTGTVNPQRWISWATSAAGLTYGHSSNVLSLNRAADVLSAFRRNIRRDDVRDRPAVQANERFTLWELMNGRNQVLPLLVDSPILPTRLLVEFFVSGDGDDDWDPPA